jgi:leucyl aminopeptidase
MKFAVPFALSATSTAVLAAGIQQQEPLARLTPSVVQNQQLTKYLIELGPYQTRWVTEEEKWALKLVCYCSGCVVSLAPH